MTRRWFYIPAVLLIVIFSFCLRSYAAHRLSVDYDEPVYLDASLRYANFLRQGTPNLIAWDETTYEHPSFYKILYAISLLSQPPLEKLHEKDLVRQSPIAAAPARDWVMAGRTLSAWIGTAAVAILALINPLAGLFLAVNTLHVTYTSEFYLEALPLLTSLISALCYSRWFAHARLSTVSSWKTHRWLVASAIFLGITAAGKYVYCVVGLAMLVHFLIAIFQKHIPRRCTGFLILWGLLALAMFFLFDPYLWPHPISRLINSLTFHMDYQASDFVRGYHYPFWQPLYWLSDYLRFYGLRPTSAFLVDLDPLIFILALVGLPRFLRKNPLFSIWLILGVLILLLWNTKWPQYTMIVLVPFCMAAAQGFSTLLELFYKPKKMAARSPF